MKATQAEIAVEAPPRENRQCPNCRFCERIPASHFVDAITLCRWFGSNPPPGVREGERTCLFRQPVEVSQGQLAL